MGLIIGGEGDKVVKYMDNTAQVWGLIFMLRMLYH